MRLRFDILFVMRVLLLGVWIRVWFLEPDASNIGYPELCGMSTRNFRLKGSPKHAPKDTGPPIKLWPQGSNLGPKVCDSWLFGLFGSLDYTMFWDFGGPGRPPKTF